ncbi:MAG: hypothetical protein ACI9DC_000738 [Gammaproteobacteria bacterium]|jgi:hypothetical protein
MSAALSRRARFPGSTVRAKAGIRLRVLVRAVHTRGVWPAIEFGQGVPHLGRRSLKQPAAAQCEQSVSDERNLVVLEVIANVSLCVSRGVVDARPVFAELEHVPVTHGLVDTGDAVCIGPWSDHGTAGYGLQFEVPPRMIAMMMRIENVGQLPTRLGQGLFNRHDFRGVNDRGQPGFGIVDEKAVIVLAS